MLPPSLRWTGDHLDLLDQRCLPHTVVYRKLTRWHQVSDAIRSMVVRGAPAIGVAAAWGVVLAARAGDDLDQAIEGLRASRPTAVNLSWALNRMQSSDAPTLRSMLVNLNVSPLPLNRTIAFLRRHW